MNNLTIIRYINRKLYCQELKRFLNLREIFNHVKEGGNVTVYDKISQEDITGYVLKDIMLRWIDIPVGKCILKIRGVE